ncbi:MAG: DUF2339 domain-containing protein [Blastocatellia bacterium]
MTDEDPSRDRIAELIQRINQMDETLRQQAWRIYHLEQRLGGAPPRPTPLAAPPQSRPKPPPSAAPPSVSRDTEPAALPPFVAPPPNAQTPGDAFNDRSHQPGRSPSARPQAPPPMPSFTSPAFAPPRAKSRDDLEARIGSNWLLRIAVITVALGIAYFLKYAYDNEWIGKNGALWICITIGVAFLVGAERLRPRYHNYAYGLTGLGIMILYTCFYAAYGLLHLWEPVPAFVGMVLVTVTATLLAARYNALPIAVLGLIGGFLTPIVLSTGHDNEVGLFSYIAMLDLGVLVLAYSKQWRALNYLAFAATVMMFIAWYDAWYAVEKLWPTIGFLTLFFAIFALLAVLYNVVNRRQTRWLDLGMVFANALLYFAASYSLLEQEYQARLGLFAVLVSAFYLALGYFTYQRDREDRLLLYTFWGLAILFVVLAVPIQFKQNWITMGWAIEGAILTWIGLRVGDRVSRYGALIIFGIAAMHWLASDALDAVYQASGDIAPLWNRRALSCAVLVAALLVAASFYKRIGERVEAGERAALASLCALGGNLLVVVLLSLEVNTYFERQGRALSASDQLERLYSYRALSLTILWVGYATAMLFVGVRRHLTVVRVAGLFLLAIALCKVLVLDLRSYDAVWHRPLLNPTFAAFVALIAATSCCAWLYARAEGITEDERGAWLSIMVIVANALAVIALSFEALGYFDARLAMKGGSADNVRDLQLAKQLWLTVVWTVYGGVLLTVGLVRRRPMLRLMALLLLGLAIAKVYVLDIWALAKLYRIVALILLGVVLLLVSFLYQPLRRRLAEADGEEARAETD